MVFTRLALDWALHWAAWRLRQRPMKLAMKVAHRGSEFPAWLCTILRLKTGITFLLQAIAPTELLWMVPRTLCLLSGPLAFCLFLGAVSPPTSFPEPTKSQFLNRYRSSGRRKKSAEPNHPQSLVPVSSELKEIIILTR